MTANSTRALSLPWDPSTSDSLDSDDDTDIDSIDADILDTGYRLPPSDSQSSQQHPECSPSLAPSTQTRNDVRRALRPSKEIQAEKYQFDEFWDHFSRKKRRRPNSLALKKHVDRAMDGPNGLHNARAYEIPSYRHSLVDSIRHGWRKNSYHNVHSGWSSPSSPTDPAPSWTQVLSAPRIRRWFLIFFVSISLSWLCWKRYGQDAWTERTTLNNAVNGRMNSNLGYFGTNKLPQFVGMTQLKTLDTHFVPGATNSRRLIFVGDVHGCHEEFDSLLSKLSFDVAADHLVLTGDLISKGPSSPAVIDLAIAFNASCVRGNHEDRVLLAYRDLKYHHRLSPHSDSHAEGEPVPSPPKPGNPNMAKEAEPGAQAEEGIDGEQFTSGDHVDQALARSLTKKQIDYLASCPVILDVGSLRGMGEVRAVHAGLVPGVSLKRQDPMSVMHMRTLDLRTHVPSRGSAGTPWSKIWNKYQSLLPRSQRSTVIYGHDSHSGLQLQKYSKGLDTGCVKGGRLTALVVSSGVNTKSEVVSVDCKDYRPKQASAAEELGSS